MYVDLSNSLFSAFLMSLTQTDQIVRAMKELGDLFQLGIVCGVDVMPALVDDLTSRVLLSASSFNLFIPENISLPSLPLFMPPSATDQSESEEDLVRRTLQQLMYVLRVSMQAANCDQFLVKHYLLKVQKKLTKTKQTVSTFSCKVYQIKFIDQLKVKPNKRRICEPNKIYRIKEGYVAQKEILILEFIWEGSVDNTVEP